MMCVECVVVVVVRSGVMMCVEYVVVVVRSGVMMCVECVVVVVVRSRVMMCRVCCCSQERSDDVCRVCCCCCQERSDDVCRVCCCCCQERSDDVSSGLPFLADLTLGLSVLACTMLHLLYHGPLTTDSEQLCHHLLRSKLLQRYDNVLMCLPQ